MSDTDAKAKLEVAVIGGGIVGLICTIAMTKEGINVHLYEATVRTRGSFCSLQWDDH